MNLVRNLAGEQFGRLTVLQSAGRSLGNRRSMWLCQCECGKTTVLPACKWRRTLSCGCARGTHHMSRSRTFSTWRDMFQRCENPESPRYKHYGGRGIKVCPQWRQFEQFFQDMGERPDGLTIDRKDNNGDYTPANCRWATRKTQTENRRCTIWIEFNGVRKTRTQWARHIGMYPSVLAKRLKNNWPFEMAITLPPDPSKQRRRKAA